MELTKEYFEQYLDTKLDGFVTKDYFDKQLDKRFADQDRKFDTKLNGLDNKIDVQTKELKAFVVEQTTEQTEALARMVNKGFEHVSSELKIVINRLDVRDKIEQFDRKFDKLENALNIKL